MTVPVPGSLTYSYDEDGVTTVFPYPVRFLEPQELTVIREVAGAQTVLAYNVDYTVSGAGNPSGGSITRTAVTDGGKIIIARSTAWKQIVDLEDKARNPAEAVELQMDRLTMAGQDVDRRVGVVEVQAAEIDDAVRRSEEAAEAAESAEQAAEEAAEAAQQAAGSVQWPVSYGISQSLSTSQRLQAQANIGVADLDAVAQAGDYEAGADQNFIRTAGYSASGDGGGALYKRVLTEPAHAGKFQSADGTWWEIVVPAEGLDVRVVGVKADGVTDDHAAIMRADSITNKLIFPQGRIRLSQKLRPLNHPIRWKGAGKASNRLSYLKKGTQFYGEHNDDCIIEIRGNTNAITEFFTLSDLEITGGSTPPNNQHGLVVGTRWHWSCLERVTFSQLTGYAIGVDPGTTSSNVAYSQNVRWTDVSVFWCGGAVGFTRVPTPGMNALVNTMLRIDNFNFDHGVHPQSPQPILLDFRAFREITGDNMVLEGSGAAGLDTVFAFGTNAYNHFKNVHSEWTTNRPEILAHFQNSGSTFYSGPESCTVFEGLNGGGKIVFDANIEHDCLIKGWQWYLAVPFSEIAEFADHTGSLTISEMQSKGLSTVPISLSGQLKVISQKSRDVAMGWRSQGPLLLAKWRPSMGAPATIKNPYMTVGYVQLTSSSIEADPDDPLLLVWRFTGTSSAMGSTNWTVTMPPDWIRNGICPWVTAVIRYRIDKSPGDEDLIARALTVGSGVALASAGETASNADGVWHTAVYSVRPNNPTFSFTTQRVGTQTGPITTRIAALDLYLGLDWAEPLDLDAP